MVRLATAAVAALVIVPSIAAPIAQQGSEDFEARAFDDFEADFFARGEDAPEFEMRSPAIRAGSLARFGKSILPWVGTVTGIGAGGLGLGLGAMANQKSGRSFDEDDELFVREIEDELDARAGGAGALRFAKSALGAFGALGTGVSIFTALKPLGQKQQARSFDEFEELDMRDPAIRASSLIKIGSAIGTGLNKVKPWFGTVAGIGAGGLGLGLGAMANQKSGRSFDEDDELFGRDFEDDELLVRAIEDELDARAGGAGALRFAKSALGAFGALGTGVSIFTALKPLGRKPQQQQAREFVDDLDARDFDDDLALRDFEDLLDYYERDLEVNELD